MKKIGLKDLVKAAMSAENPDSGDVVTLLRGLQTLGIKFVKSEEVEKVCMAHADVLRALEVVEGKRKEGDHSL